MNDGHFISISFKKIVFNLEFFKETREGIPLNLKLDFSNQNHSWEIETLGVWLSLQSIQDFRDKLVRYESCFLFDIEGRKIISIFIENEKLNLVMSDLKSSTNSGDDIFKMSVRIGKPFVKDLIESLSFLQS